jgi:hypothetical protein
MSTLTKEQLILLKEQFKSVHNVLPSRFLEDDDYNVKATKVGDDATAGEKSRQQSMVNDKGDATFKNFVKKSQS